MLPNRYIFEVYRNIIIGAAFFCLSTVPLFLRARRWIESHGEISVPNNDKSPTPFGITLNKHIGAFPGES